MSRYDLEKAIGQQVEYAHGCEDNACDIRAMLGEGLYVLAAHRLFGATDVMRGDPLEGIDCDPESPCGLCLHCAWETWAKTLDDETIRNYLDREEELFSEHHEQVSAQCPHCETIIYVPSNSDASDALYCSNCAKRSVIRYRLAME